MKILVIGASGLLGTAITLVLKSKHDIHIITTTRDRTSVSEGTSVLFDLLKPYTFKQTFLETISYTFSSLDNITKKEVTTFIHD